MIQKPILVIAPYDNEELLTRCESNDKRVVYFPDARARSPLIQNGIKHVVMCITPAMYEDWIASGQEIYLAEQLIKEVDQAIENRHRVVYILIPESFMQALVTQADIANDTSGLAGSIREERYVRLIQRYKESSEVDPSHLFRVIEHKYTNYSEYSLSTRVGVVRPAPPRERRRSSHNEKPPFSAEAEFKKVAAGDYSGLAFMKDEELRLVIDKCLDKDLYALAGTVNAVLLERENRAL